MPTLTAMADFFVMTTDFFSFGDLVGTLIGLVVVGALIFGVSMSADDQSGLSKFLRHKQNKADDLPTTRKRR